MQATWRIRLTWTLAIAYGFVAAMGEGLHLLPGQCHDACCDDACCRADACPGDGCSDDGCPGDGCQTDGGRFDGGKSGGCGDCRLVVALSHDASGSPKLAATPGSHDHDHCAICQFLAQGTWFLQPTYVPQWQFFRGYERPAKAIFVARRPEHLPFLSRAPPASVDC